MGVGIWDLQIRAVQAAVPYPSHGRLTTKSRMKTDRSALEFPPWAHVETEFRGYVLGEAASETIVTLFRNGLPPTYVWSLNKLFVAVMEHELDSTLVGLEQSDAVRNDLLAAGFEVLDVDRDTRLDIKGDIE